LKILWVMVSHCLYEETPLEAIQAALPTAIPLDGMREADKNAALKKLCKAIKAAWLTYERPKINAALHGSKVKRKMANFRVLAAPARRRIEVFVRADNSGDWYHQGATLTGQMTRTCYF